MPSNPQTLPNLAGVATNDLVEQIGSGSFKASYINWSRTLQLLRQHAPGWLVDTVPSSDGSLIHRAPVGGYLLIRFVHVDGTATPAVPQAIMDHRNSAIPYDKITARDITDTQRRGACLAAAMIFGLAAELWAKQPLESGWGQEGDEPAKASVVTAPKSKKEVETQEEPSESSFREIAIERGLSTYAVDALVELIKGDYAKGIATINKKNKSEIASLNAKYAPATDSSEEEQW